MTRGLRFLLACCATALFWTPVKEAAAEQGVVPRHIAMPILAEGALQEEIWMAMFLDGQHAGYQHSTMHEARDAKGQPWQHYRMKQHLALSRFGVEMPVTVSGESYERPEKGLEAFVFSVQMGPLEALNYRGTRDGDKMWIVGSAQGAGTVQGREYEQLVPWPKEALSPQAEERRFRARLKKGDKKFSHVVFNPMEQKPSTTTYSVGEMESVQVMGKLMRLRRVLMTMDSMPEMPATAWVDEKGDVQKVTTNLGLFGVVEMHRCAGRDAAVPKGGGAEVMVTTLVKPSKPIPNPQQASLIRYRIAFKGSQSVPAFSKTDHQNPKDAGNGIVALDVRRINLPPRDAEVKSAARPGREYLDGNVMLQADDPEIFQMAQRLTADMSSGVQKARALTQWVFRRIEKKDLSVGFASAKEVFQNPRGDCTEHAVLLAAMLRAAGVPARVAVGMVYSQDLEAFGYHMWTEAYIGDDWYGLDATTGKAGVTATHLKLSDSSLAKWPDMTLMNNVLKALQSMEIQVVEVKHD